MTTFHIQLNFRPIKGSKAALKAVYLAIANKEKKWTYPVRDWGSVINQLIIKFGDRCGVL